MNIAPVGIRLKEKIESVVGRRQVRSHCGPESLGGQNWGYCRRVTGEVASRWNWFAVAWELVGSPDRTRSENGSDRLWCGLVSTTRAPRQVRLHVSHVCSEHRVALAEVGFEDRQQRRDVVRCSAVQGR